ncbi:hypothetical protein HaLaN_22495, partial [Haematococcus lacustris]
MVWVSVVATSFECNCHSRAHPPADDGSGASPSASCLAVTSGRTAHRRTGPPNQPLRRRQKGAERSQEQPGQQTVPAMSQRDMQHQVTVDGSASATDGYSPASEAPTPATRLLDLPPALLDDIACRVMQLGARSQLPLTCHAFSQARLMHFPALRIQLGRQRCDQLLTPRVVAALQARTSKLALTLWQPETDDSEGYRKQLAPTLQLPQTEDTQDYTELLTHALAKLDNCTAVEVCRLVSCGTYRSDKRKHLRCPPGLTQQLLDSFPSLTALTLEGLSVSSDALASLLSHPPLALQLQQLHLTNDSVPNGEVPKSVGLAFQGLRLKQLSIDAIRPEPGTPPLPSFQSLAQHLTQLHLMIGCVCRTYLSFYREYLQPLAQLQVLTISNLYRLNGLTEVLQALPQLHTLQLPDVTVRGQQELNTLLAATQITSLHLRQVKALDTSYADAPCSWQRLELTAIIQRKVLAYLPLHSLSQLLVLGRFAISVEDIPDPEVAGALHLLTEAIKVPVQIKEVELRMRIPYEVITPALLQQQRVDLEHLISLLQPLQCCCVDKVEVRGLDRVTAADVLALAPLCRDCTYFELDGGSVEPSLEFWRQLVQLMPTVQEVIFYHVEGSISAAMHESLQLMAEQPWARQAATQPAASEPGPSIPPPGKRSKRTMAVQAAEPTQPNKGTGQQTAPAMSQQDMQHHDTGDGSASATDGYSSAGKAPPPATRLLDLPPALLDDIACRVMQLGARNLLPLTCRAFSQARLLHVPALRIQLGWQCCDQLLTPRVLAVLQVRKSKLALTLWQPETEDSDSYHEQLAQTLRLPQTEYTQDYTELLAHALAKLDNCAAVEVCKLVSSGLYDPDKRKHLHCPPGLAQQLLGSFPSLTALTLDGLSVSSVALASLLSHPPLALQLQQLDIAHIISQNGDMPFCDEPGAVVPLFQGLQLKQLSMAAILFEQPGPSLLPSFQPLAQHLTQLHLESRDITYSDEDLSFLREFMQPLVLLQVLTISNHYGLEGLTELLQALPQLHTLQLPDAAVSGQQQLNTLLAATQITSLQLGGVRGLDASRADAPCSWQRLELTWERERLELQWIDWEAITHLPLHSLSQPLVLGRADIR